MRDAGEKPWLWLLLVPQANHKVPPYRAWSGGRAAGVSGEGGMGWGRAGGEVAVLAKEGPGGWVDTLEHAACSGSRSRFTLSCHLPVRQGAVITQCFPTYYYAVHETGHRLGFRHANMYRCLVVKWGVWGGWGHQAGVCWSGGWHLSLVACYLRLSPPVLPPHPCAPFLPTPPARPSARPPTRPPRLNDTSSVPADPLGPGTTTSSGYRWARSRVVPPEIRTCLSPTRQRLSRAPPCLCILNVSRATPPFLPVPLPRPPPPPSSDSDPTDIMACCRGDYGLFYRLMAGWLAGRPGERLTLGRAELAAPAQRRLTLWPFDRWGGRGEGGGGEGGGEQEWV